MIKSELTSLVIQGTIIPYEERRNCRSKRLSMRIGKEKVRVTVPYRASKREIQEFVTVNQEWILKNWLKMQEKLTKAAVQHYLSEKAFPLLGQPIPFQTHITNRKRATLRYFDEGHRIEIYLPAEIPTEQHQNVLREIIEKWLKQKGHEIFQSKLDQFSVLMDVKYKTFRLKEQKTRWGSCSSKGNINLNWRAIMAPESVVNYLVIHELAHLKYMNHSQAFWEFVGQYCSDYAAQRHWLKVNGESLTLD